MVNHPNRSKTEVAAKLRTKLQLSGDEYLVHLGDLLNDEELLRLREVVLQTALVEEANPHAHVDA